MGAGEREEKDPFSPFSPEKYTRTTPNVIPTTPLYAKYHNLRGKFRKLSTAKMRDLRVRFKARDTMTRLEKSQAI